MDVVWAAFDDGLENFTPSGRVHEVECWMIDAHDTVGRLELAKVSDRQSVPGNA